MVVFVGRAHEIAGSVRKKNLYDYPRDAEAL